MSNNTETLIYTIVSVLFSGAAWKFYEEKMKKKAQLEQHKREDNNMYREDLRSRVKKLESLLTQSEIEKNKMREQILECTKELSELRVKVEFLEKENERLKNK